MPSNAVTPNLNKGTDKKPVIIAAMAPFSLNFFQKRDRIIVGQKVAAMPDQPKITNQNIVLSGTAIATIIAIINAKTANTRVMIREVLASSFSVLLGLKIC